MVLAVLTATIVLTLASVSYIEPAAAHHRIHDDPDPGEDAEVAKEAEDKAAEAEEAAQDVADEEAEAEEEAEEEANEPT